MSNQQWVFIALALVVGYLLGVKFPATGQQVMSKFSGAVSA